MHVDVVIPMFNGSAFIRETIETVFRQTVRPGRIIVVDDHSTDRSPLKAAGFENVILLQNNNKGPASARNLGFEYTTAPYVAFLDYDDVWHPQHLERLCTLLDQHPGCALAAAGLKSFYHGSTPVFDVTDTSVDFFDPWQIYPTHDFACSPSITLVRRDFLINAGGWTDAHGVISDYSLWMRAGVDTPIVRSRAKTVAYRLHPASVTANHRRDPSQFMQLSLLTDDHLLQHFLASNRSEHEKRLMRMRNATAHYLAALICAMADEDRGRLKKMIYLLEMNLRNESSAFIRSLLYYIFYMNRHFYAGLDTAAINRRYTALLEVWPNTSPTAKGILTSMIIRSRPGLPFYINYYTRKPWEISRLKPFLSAMASKI